MNHNPNAQYSLIPSISHSSLYKDAKLNQTHFIGNPIPGSKSNTTMNFMAPNFSNETNVPVSQPLTAASVNLNSKFSIPYTVKLSSTKAESKRLVLAFESRISSEINWALNTLAIFSCNTN